MKTILIIRNADPSDFGGAEIYQVNLAAALKDLGLHPIIVTHHTTLHICATKHKIKTLPSPYLKKRNWSGLHVLLFPIYLIWQLRLSLFYCRLIRRANPFALHIQSRDDFIAATYAAKLFKKQIVWSDHADLKHAFQNLFIPLKNPIGKLIFRAAKHASAITICSSSDFDQIKTLTKNRLKNTQLLHNSVPDQFPNFPAKKSKKTKSSTLNFIIISRINTDKGIGEAITAFTTVQQKYPEITLDVYGTGPELDHFKQLAQNTPNIHFFGHTAHPLDKLSHADIFISPTYHEGFSLSILEAAMMQKPIITTDIPANRELLQHDHSALLTPVKDSSALADAMTKLIENQKLRDQLAQNARAAYTENFNFTQNVQQKILPLYTPTRPIKIRVEASVLASPIISGVGAYTQQFIDNLSQNPSVQLHISYFNFLNRKPHPTTAGPSTHRALRLFPLKIYAKLISYGVPIPFDLFLPRVDLTIFPNFVVFPSIKTRHRAVTIHDLSHIYFPEVVETKNLAHLNRVVPRAVKKSDLIFTVSETSKSAIAKEYQADPNKILVTYIAPDPIYSQKSPTKIHEKYQIPFKKFILFVGNFEPRKNLATLIRAYQLLPKNLKSQYGLILVGGNSWKNQETKDLLDQAIAQGENILHIDHVPREQTVAFYQHANLFVMPSLYEGFGMPIVEAATCRVPILASDIPVLREVGGDGCLYAETLSPKDFATKIEKILSDPKLQSQLKKSATQNLSRFNWTTNINTLIDRLSS